MLKLGVTEMDVLVIGPDAPTNVRAPWVVPLIVIFELNVVDVGKPTGR